KRRYRRGAGILSQSGGYEEVARPNRLPQTCERGDREAEPKVKYVTGNITIAGTERYRYCRHKLVQVSQTSGGIDEDHSTIRRMHRPLGRCRRGHIEHTPLYRLVF